MRIVGRGGQGVVTAAELLAVAAVAEGRHGQALPTFGFDGIGAAMSFCRIGDRPIRAREPIGPPNGVIVLDPAVLHQVDLSSWLGSDGYALINSKRTLEELGLRELAATLQEDRCLTIPAVELAHGQAGGSLPNASLLGGFAALSEAVSLPSLEGAIRKRFPGPIGDANIVAAEAAFEYVENRLNGRATKVRSTSSPPRRRLSTSRIGSMAELRKAQRPSYEGKEASTR